MEYSEFWIIKLKKIGLVPDWEHSWTWNFMNEKNFRYVGQNEMILSLESFLVV